jgi:PAS domain S-box-containing protein
MSSGAAESGRWAHWIAWVCGGLIAALGVTVIVGWHARIPVLLQIKPGYIAMAYYTAVCLVATGVALIALERGWRICGRAAASIPLIVGALFCIQYGLSIDLGIDQLLVSWEGPSPQRYPGRMAPATAICFVVLGTAMLLMSLRSKPRAIGAIVGASVSAVIALGAMAVVGYFTGLSGTYVWGKFSGMALHTALAMIVAGIGLLALQCAASQGRSFLEQRWLPFATALFGAVATLVMCQALLAREHEQLVQEASIRAEHLKEEMEERLNAGALGLRRIANRWAKMDNFSEVACQEDAAAYLRDEQTFSSISRLTREGNVDWGAELEAHMVEIRTTAAAEISRHTHEIQRARLEDAVIATDVVPIGDGQLGVILYASLYRDGAHYGTLAGRLPIAQLLSAGLKQMNTASDFQLRVLQRGEPVFSTAPEGQQIYSVATSATIFTAHGLELAIEFSPTVKFAKAHDGLLPIIFATVGFMFSVVLAAAVRLAQKTRQESRLAASANENLSRQIREREISEAQYRAVSEAAIDGIVIGDAEGNILHWNQAAERIFGYVRDEVVGKPLTVIMPERFRAMHIEGMRRFQAGGAPRAVGRTVELVGLRKNGEEFPLEISLGSWALHGARYFSGIVRDITERKRAEKALVDANERLEQRVEERTRELAQANEQLMSSQRRLNATLLSGGIGTWTWDVETGQVEWDDSVSQLIGVEPREPQSLELFFSRVLPEDRPVLSASMETAMKNGSSFSSEYRVMQKDGSTRWISGKGSFDAGVGAKRRVTGACIDITKVREALEERRRSEESLRFLADVMPQMVYTATPDGTLDYWNSRTFDYTGVKVADLLGWAWESIIHPADLPGVLEAWKRSMETGRPYQKETRYRAADGSYRWHLERAYPQRNAEGVIVRWVGTCTDVHDQKELAEVLEKQVRERTAELREKEQFLHSIFAGVDLGIAIFDLTEGDTLRVAALNPAFEERIGKEALGRCGEELTRTSEVLDPESLALVRDRLTSCARSGLILEFETRIEANGALSWWYWQLTPIRRTDGSVFRVIATALDITERKELEQSLAQARDQALEASRLKSEFLATMSHEIRTPMNGIMGMAGLLMQTRLEPRQREMGNVIRRSAESLLQIINDILDFSKIEAGKMRLNQEHFSLRDLLEETAAILSSHAHGKGLELICDLDPALRGEVLGDPGRLQQVVTNLVGNAIKFTESGEVVLRARVLDGSSDEAHIRIEVVDTGIGMPAPVQQRLFQPFTQGDGSTTRRFGGTGLGLAICRQLIRLMNGTIGCQSVEGKGSTFWVDVRLPRVAEQRTSTLSGLLGAVRALIVDDNATNRQVLVGQLATLGVTVSALDRAHDVVPELRRAAASGQPYELVILDFNMPGVNGIQVAQQIRAQEALLQPKLLLLSSAMIDQPGDLLAAARIDCSLDKPVRESQLRRAVMRLAGRAGATRVPFPDTQKPQQSSAALKLLLVEDNASNQLVATMMLEHEGHVVEIATNGREALQKLALTRYDAVLMDCQMPEMDGYEATKRIRAGEVPGLNRRIPIIALTAHALSTDRAKCLACGMDEYISKPIDAETLRTVFLRCGIKPAKAVASDSPAAVAPRVGHELPVLDDKHIEQLRALKNPNGRGTLAHEIAAMFFKELPTRVGAIRDFAERHQGEELSRIAHTLAGSCASLGAKRLRQVLVDLETAAKQGSWERIPERLHAVSGGVAELKNELSRLELLT